MTGKVTAAETERDFLAKSLHTSSSCFVPAHCTVCAEHLRDLAVSVCPSPQSMSPLFF